MQIVCFAGFDDDLASTLKLYNRQAKKVSSKFKSMLGENIMISFCFLIFSSQNQLFIWKCFAHWSAVEIKINGPGITWIFFLVKYKIFMQAVLLEVFM